MSNRHLLARSLCIVTLAALAGCNTIEAIATSLPRPTASIKGVSLSDITLEDLQLTFDVEVKNPYAVGLPLTQINYGLASGSDQAFVDGRIDGAGTIPARQSKVVAVPVRLNYTRVLSALSNVRPGDVVPYTASLDVVFNPPAVDPITLPLRKRGELPIPTAPRVRDAKMEWSALGLGGAEGRMQMQLDNLNSFGIEIRGFNCDMTLGGISIAGTRLAQPASFDANGSGLIDIPVNISTTSLGLAALNMLRSGSTDFAVGGHMQIVTPFGNMDIPWAYRGRTSQ